MTPERNHIAKYLTSFIEENYENLSDTAKTDEAVSNEILSKEALIKLVNSNPDFLDWFFTEGLRHYIVTGDYFEPLIINGEYAEDVTILKIESKFIKWWYDFDNHQDYFQFVEQKTKLVEVTYYE
jgi:hypothetical protein